MQHVWDGCTCLARRHTQRFEDMVKTTIHALKQLLGGLGALLGSTQTLRLFRHLRILCLGGRHIHAGAAQTHLFYLLLNNQHLLVVTL